MSFNGSFADSILNSPRMPSRTIRNEIGYAMLILLLLKPHHSRDHGKVYCSL